MSLFKQHRRVVATALVTVALFLFLPLAVYAAGDAHGGGHEGIGLAFAWKVINFAIIFYALFHIGRKVLPGVLVKRRDEVVHALDEAKRMEEEATRMFGEYEAKMKNLDGEIEGMIADAKQRAEKQAALIVDRAKKDAEDIVAAAKRSAARLEEQAQYQLRSLIADEAIQVAETKLKNEFLSGKDVEKKQSQLIDQFTSEVNRLEKH